MLPSHLVPVGGLYVKGPILEVLTKLGLRTLSEEQITNIAQSEVDEIIAKHEKYEEEMRRLDDDRRKGLLPMPEMAPMVPVQD